MPYSDGFLNGLPLSTRRRFRRGLTNFGPLHASGSLIVVLNEGSPQRAHGLYTDSLVQCDPAWPLYGSILNNRGITRFQLDQSEAAIADFSAVIDAPSASNEARACALNNRVDMLLKNGDVAGSVADRTAVLALPDTTFNRRYIALIRRAKALRRLGNDVGAHQDVESILETDDIAVEQKMAARLERAEWLVEAGEIARAKPDLNAIVGSYRNFDGAEQRARELRIRTTYD